MPNIFEVESTVRLLILLASLAISIYAFVNALLYSAESYVAAGKATKATWCTILGIGVVLYFVPVGLFIVTLAAFIAALVYLVDVRPALRGLTRR